MLKAILFDVDETLIDWSGFRGSWIDAERPHVLGVYEYLSSIQPGFTDADTYIDTYTGLSQKGWAQARHSLVAPHLGRLLVDAALALGIPDDAVTMDACLDAYGWQMVEGTTVFPDVVPALEKLSAAGLRLGTVTNAFSPSRLRDIELAGHGLLRYFQACRLTAADVGYLKPHPRIFHEALRRLQAEPEEVVYVGDNPVADIAGAQAAGLRAILRVKSPPQTLLSGLIVPDAAINQFSEIEAVLDDWFPGWQGALKAAEPTPPSEG